MQEELIDFLYTEAKEGRLGIAPSPLHQIEGRLNVFDMIDSLSEHVEEANRKVASYEVMYLRKMVVKKIAKDFESWFPLSGLPFNEWKVYAVSYAKRYIQI